MKKLIQLKNINDEQLDPVNLNYETRISKNEEQIATNETSIENLNGTVLYENESNTTDTVTLNDSASNYSYLEIQYNSNSNFSCVRISNPNNKIISLLVDGEGKTDGYLVLCSASIQILNTTIAFLKNLCITFSTTSSSIKTETSDWYAIKIVKVIGYK